MHKLYQTINVEHDVPVEGKVTGDIPSWVRGSLYRNGPGMFEVGDDKYNTCFDGMAMFQRFHIDLVISGAGIMGINFSIPFISLIIITSVDIIFNEMGRNKILKTNDMIRNREHSHLFLSVQQADKKVKYQSRYLRSEAYNKNLTGQRIAVSEFGTVKTPDPCQSLFQRFLSKFVLDEPSDNCLVNFFPLQDELYVTKETPIIHRIDPDTLESMERVDLSKIVAVNLATAHPHYDPDGTVYNQANSCKDKMKTCFIKLLPKKGDGDGFPTGEIVASIDSDYKTSINYAHSFGMTENYFIFIQQPFILNFLTVVVNKVVGKPFCSSLQFYDNIMARFRIIDRKTGQEVNEEIHFEAKPFLFWHQINAYEENGHLVIDFCAYKDASMMEAIKMKNLASEKCETVFRKHFQPEPRRYVLPLNVDSASPMDKNLVTLAKTTATAVRQDSNTILCNHETLAETGFEFPQINYGRYNGKKYKYAYGVGFHQHAPIYSTLCKIDTTTKTFVEWKEENCYPSEPVFVPNPNGNDEDDGVLLSAIGRTDFEFGNNSFFLVLDAKTMEELARVDFNVPRFPRDFHGLFKTE